MNGSLNDVIESAKNLFADFSQNCLIEVHLIQIEETFQQNSLFFSKLVASFIFLFYFYQIPQNSSQLAILLSVHAFSIVLYSLQAWLNILFIAYFEILTIFVMHFLMVVVYLIAELAKSMHLNLIFLKIILFWFSIFVVHELFKTDLFLLFLVNKLGYLIFCFYFFIDT